MSDIADANVARMDNMAKLRRIRLARDQQEAQTRAAAAALPKPKTRARRAAKAAS